MSYSNRNNYHHGPVMRTTPKLEMSRGVIAAQRIIDKGDRYDAIRALQHASTIREPGPYDQGYAGTLSAWLSGGN